MASYDFLNQLNKQQEKAVLAADGPSIVLAGAGSGKTRVLVSKVLYLILEKKINPLNILMVTFTNKAAGEMQERITTLLKEYTSTKDKPTIGTFHSICARILRKSGYAIGIAHNFLIYDEIDQQDAVKQALKELDIQQKEVRPRSALSVISQAKNELITPQMYKELARGYFQEKIAKIYPVYQRILKNNGALDFDDLLLETISLFKKNPQVLSYYQDLFQYILIDEYQDTNHAQYEITKLLAQKHQNICVVGDFSQSIYSFRGADFRNLERFNRDFKNCKTFSLSQNYRSTQKILDSATAIISKNTSHPILRLWTENTTGDDLTIFQADNEHHEIEYIIERILEHQMENKSFKLSDCAILYRTNAQSRTIEEVLLHHSIPYILIGGVRFYERKEIKDVLSLLTHLANPNDTVSYERILKIGKRRAEKFFTFAKDFVEKKQEESLHTLEILDEAIRQMDYLSLFDEKIAEDKARVENIKELRSVALEFPRLMQFLENVALVERESVSNRNRTIKTAVENKTKPEAITLMTLHQAKGLEFKFVAIVGMEEGIFPHAQSLLDSSQIEEERRLCYVGMTRAKEKLYLLYSRRRLLYGQSSNNIVSRFILELPEDVLATSMSATSSSRTSFSSFQKDIRVNHWDEEPF